jgi:hypothetical protein
MSENDWTAEERAELARWVVALRQAYASGARQSNGNLRDRYGYCCLGIWCDVKAFQGQLTMKRDDDPVGLVSYFADGGRPDGWASYLPSTARLAGSENPIVLDAGHKAVGDRVVAGDNRATAPFIVQASVANDDDGLNFDQIADCVTWTYRLTEAELTAARAAQVAEMANGAPW